VGLVQKCEMAHEMLMKAGRVGGTKRGEDFDLYGADMGLQRLSMEREKENRHNGEQGPGVGVYGMSSTISCLQQLQFEGPEPFSGPNSTSGDRHAWEVQITYCGLGPHYRLPVADVLSFNEVRLLQSHQSELRKEEREHRRKERLKESARSNIGLPRKGASSTRGGESEGEEEEQKARYLTLLNQGLQNRQKNKKKREEVLDNPRGKSRSVSPPRVPQERSRGKGGADQQPDRNTLISPPQRDLSPPPPISKQPSHTFTVTVDDQGKGAQEYESDVLQEPLLRRPWSCLPLSEMTREKRESALASILFSTEVTDFINSIFDPESGDPLPFSLPSTAWAERLFSPSLSLPPHILSALSLAQSLNPSELASDSSYQELLRQILGPPPMPWARPSTSLTAAPSMRALNKLFESGYADADRIMSDSREVWRARVELFKQVAEAQSRVARDTGMAVEELRKLGALVATRSNENEQGRVWGEAAEAATCIIQVDPLINDLIFRLPLLLSNLLAPHDYRDCLGEMRCT
jgi:hypothetical protein